MAEPQQRPPVLDWASDFDHFEPGFVADPYPVYDRLRSCPVAHSDRYGGMHVLTRWADVADAAHDTTRFTSRRVVVNEVPTSERGLPLPPINSDPPEHGPVRRSVLPYFNPRAMAAWEGPIREICDRQLDRLEGRADCDAAVDYAQLIPSEITAMMLGAPLSDGERLRQWIHLLVEVGPTDTEVLRRTSHEVVDYLQAIVDRCRRGEPVAGVRPAPGGDVVSFLLSQTETTGQDDDELVRILFLLLVAGVDTTWSAIGSALLHLASHPEDRRRLVAEPDLLLTATEELLRAYAPVTMARVAAQDTVVGGCPVRAGDWVMVSFPAANRDPEVFERADEVVLDREHNRHAAFGLGIHRCLGSNLARLEVQVAVERWLARFPEFELTDPAAVTFSSGQVRGPRRVPVRLR